MKIIKKILNLFENIMSYAGMFFLVLMVLIVSLQVFTRYFLNMTPYWSEEVALLLMVWFGFLGIAIGVKKGIHLSINFFVNLLPAGVRNIVIKLVELLISFFGVLLMIYGYKLVQYTSSSTLPATQWPASTIYLMVPFSGVMIVFFALARMMGLISPSEKNKDLELDGTEDEVKPW